MSGCHIYMTDSRKTESQNVFGGKWDLPNCRKGDFENHCEGKWDRSAFQEKRIFKPVWGEMEYVRIPEKVNF